MVRPPRAKLRRGKARLEEDVRPSMASRQDDVINLKRKRRNPLPALFRSLVGMIILTLLVAVTVAVTVSMTVLAIIPKGNLSDLTAYTVVRNAYPLGQAPNGTIAYVQAGPSLDTLNDRINQTLGKVEGGAVVEIIAGPLSVVGSKGPGKPIVVNGKTTNRVGEVTRQRLQGEYLVICIEGACGTPGAPAIVPRENLIGRVAGVLSLNGKSPVPAVPATATTGATP
jgi:hypothetical protein